MKKLTGQMESLGKHPFNYDLQTIRGYIVDLVENELFYYAKKSIKYIKDQYTEGIETGEIKTENTFRWFYLKPYHEADKAGRTCPDGTDNTFIYELKHLAKWVKMQNPKQNRKQKNKSKTILDTNQLMAKLSVTRPTLSKWRKANRIPFIQVGSVVRYDLDKVLEALESKTKTQ